jgi:hypothetical protein
MGDLLRVLGNPDGVCVTATATFQQFVKHKLLPNLH